MNILSARVKPPQRKSEQTTRTTTEEMKTQQTDSDTQTSGRKRGTTSITETDACACAAWQRWKEQKSSTTQMISPYITSSQFVKTMKNAPTYQTPSPSADCIMTCVRMDG